MIGRLLVFVAGIAIAALFVPDLAARLVAKTDRPAEVAAVREAEPAAAGGTFRLPMDPSGHFIGNFRLNGRSESGMVDTGASLVALNLSTAQRIGIPPSRLSFDGRVSTANGLVEAARTTIDRIEIGGIALTGVEAVVLPDRALSGTLIGMSFLSRLASYKVEGLALHMRR
ncbi:retropepsin-like aspartic protease family protein [Ensifer soli]|uniref:retropepsin-like aspartic protease family protein n=1 Tax=Ciceribacter sp. sgz301302 TaxID=3342379 RepID=UPI0035B8EB59